MPDDEYTFISLLSILLKRSRVSDFLQSIWFIAYYLFMFI